MAQEAGSRLPWREGVHSPLSPGPDKCLPALLQAGKAICVPLSPHPLLSLLSLQPGRILTAEGGGCPQVCTAPVVGQPLRGSPWLVSSVFLKEAECGRRADALHRHVARGLDRASGGHEGQGRQRGSARTPVAEPATSQPRVSWLPEARKASWSKAGTRHGTTMEQGNTGATARLLAEPQDGIC